MKPGQIIYHKGRWFRVLLPSQPSLESDWLEWRDDQYPALDCHCDERSCYDPRFNLIAVREIEPLIGEMLKIQSRKGKP